MIGCGVEAEPENEGGGQAEAPPEVDLGGTPVFAELIPADQSGSPVSVVVAFPLRRSSRLSPDKTPKRRTAADKWYEVFEGVSPGVYDSWEAASLQTQGVSLSSYRSFGTRTLAVHALRAYDILTDDGDYLQAAEKGSRTPSRFLS